MSKAFGTCLANKPPTEPFIFAVPFKQRTGHVIVLKCVKRFTNKRARNAC